MKPVRQSLIYFISFVLALPASAGPKRTLSSELPEEAQKQAYFATTEPLQTDGGALHIEVQNFKIENSQDLAQARNEILSKVSGLNTSQEFIIGRARSSDYQESALDGQTEALVQDVKSGLGATPVAELKADDIGQVDKSKFKMNYNITLGLLRGVLNGGTVFAGLVIGKGIAMEHALLIGTLAGAISAGIQIKSDLVFSWLKNSVLLVNAAKRLRLIPNREGMEPSRAENVLKEVQMYSKWATLEAGFLLVCQTAMGLLHIPVTENILLTTAKSTASQGVYEVGILKMTDQLSAMSPEWARRAQVFKNVSLFTGSGVSVLAAIGSMVGMPFSNLGFVALGATGLVFVFGAKMGLAERAISLFEKFKKPAPQISETPRAAERPPRESRPVSTSRARTQAVGQCRQLIFGI